MHRRRFLGSTATLGAGAIGGCLDLGGDGGSDPSIQIPDDRLLDRPIEVVFTDLPSDERVIVTAATEPPESDDRWTAEATFEVGYDGHLALAEQAPVEGDYEDIDPMGLFLAMETETRASGTAFPMATHDVDISVHRPDDAEPMATATTSRTLPDVETESFEDDVVGTIHFPSEVDTAPAIVLLHGSGGDPMDESARLFAANGFVAGSLQYFGDPEPLPDRLLRVPVETVDRAAEQLLDHDRVVGDEIGVYGASKGGELALLAGVHVETVGAVVSRAGSGIVWEGLTQAWRPVGGSSWSIGGDPVSYVPFSMQQAGSTIGSFYESSLAAADEETVRSATVPLERADAPGLAVSGTDDRMWDAVGLTEAAIHRIEDADGGPEYEHLVYENAGHFIRPPYLPTYGTASDTSSTPGGTSDANARASRDHWPQVLSLFEERLEL